MKSEIVKCHGTVDGTIMHKDTKYGILYYMYLTYSNRKLIVVKSITDKYTILVSDDSNDLGLVFEMKNEYDAGIYFKKVPSNYKVELKND